MKQFIGIVINTKEKTAVVKVDSFSQHPIYKKRIRRSHKYLVDAQLPVTPGETVVFQETRPLSKRKHWKIIQVVKK